MRRQRAIHVPPKKGCLTVLTVGFILMAGIKSAEAGGHHVPGIFLSSSAISSFNESMNRSFRDELRRNDRGSEFWNHVKTMSLEGDKLVVTTQAE